MMGTEALRYQGQELDIFAHAKCWKKYWASRIDKWIRGDVLEVGAGLGTNSLLLQNSNVRSWHCLEPDPELCLSLRSAVAKLQTCTVSLGTAESLDKARFDCVLYIDVLEHIEADREEIARAAALLRPGGHIVVLSPAHQLLFSTFDSTIGHHRRYNRRSLLKCSPNRSYLEAMFYLDCVGVFVSLVNRMLLRQRTPTLDQIRIWDTYLVPISRLCDRALAYKLGKSIVSVWTRI